MYNFPMNVCFHKKFSTTFIQYRHAYYINMQFIQVSSRFFLLLEMHVYFTYKSIFSVSDDKSIQRQGVNSILLSLYLSFSSACKRVYFSKMIIFCYETKFIICHGMLYTLYTWIPLQSIYSYRTRTRTIYQSNKYIFIS